MRGKIFIMSGIGLLIIFALSIWVYRATGNEVDGYFPVLGVSYKIINNELSVFVDEHQAISGAQEVIKYGKFYKEWVSVDYAVSHPINFSSFNTIIAIPFIIKKIYNKSSSLDSIGVNVYLMHPNEYGENIRYLMFYFDFDRELYKKINWNNFDSRKLISILPNFQIGNLYSCAQKTEINSYYRCN